MASERQGFGLDPTWFTRSENSKAVMCPLWAQFTPPGAILAPEGNNPAPVLPGSAEASSREGPSQETGPWEEQHGSTHCLSLCSCISRLHCLLIRYANYQGCEVFAAFHLLLN